MTKIRIGIAGTGAMAARMTAALLSSRAAAPAAVASADMTRAEHFAKAYQLKGFESVAAMARDGAVDAVYVANRNRDHAAAALAAIASGKPVLVEKPLATTAIEAASIVEAAKAKGVLLMEGLWPLHLPALARLAGAAESGVLGKARHLYADFGHAAPRALFPSLYLPDSGVIRDRMTYLAALAVRLFGPAESVSARTIRDETGVDVVSAATLVHAGGALAQLGASFLSEMSNEALLSCERGVVRLAAPLLGSESVGLRRRSQPAAPAPAAAGAKARVTERLKREPLLRRARAALGESREYLPYGEDPYHAEIAHFAALIGAGRTESPVVDHALSLETARILDALRAGDGS